MPAQSLLTLTALSMLSGIVGAASPLAVRSEIKVRDTTTQWVEMPIKNTVSAAGTGRGGGYAIELGLGTPAQKMLFQLSTGSSEILALQKGPVCDDPSALCNPNNIFNFTTSAFDSGASTSLSKLDNTLNSFIGVPGVQTQYSGTYASDTVGLGSVSISKVTIGQVDKATQPDAVRALGYPITGTFGLGYESGESITDQQKDKYTGIVRLMHDQGLIDAQAFSVWLNSPSSSEGSVLFGAYDTTKYTGDLVAIPVIQSVDNSLSRLYVPWTKFTWTTSDGGSVDIPFSSVPALLDVGASWMYLPQDVADKLFGGLGVEQNVDGNYYVPCNSYFTDTNLTFSFNNDDRARITVPLGAMINIELTITDDASGVDYCPLKIITGTDYATFGIPLLQYMYFMLDLESNYVAIAQSNFNSGAASPVGLSPDQGFLKTATVTATAISTAIMTAQKTVTKVPAPVTVTKVSIAAPKPTLKFGASVSRPGPTGTRKPAAGKSSKAAAAGIAQPPRISSTFMVVVVVNVLAFAGGALLIL